MNDVNMDIKWNIFIKVEVSDLIYLYVLICVYPFLSIWTSQVVLVVKNPPANARDIKKFGLSPWVQKIPERRKWLPTPVFLPGKFPGQRNSRLKSIGPQRGGHEWETDHTHTHLSIYWSVSFVKLFTTVVKYHIK